MDEATHKDQQKPKEILELEELLSYEFELSNGSYNGYHGFSIASSSYLMQENKVIALSVANRDVSKLDRLAFFENLKCFDATECKLSDISFLSDCKELEVLYLGGNHIHDLSPIGRLHNLKYLSLWGNALTDSNILEIRNLRYLEGLYVSQNQLTDFQFACNHPDLKKIYISRNVIRDLSPIMSLNQLEVLLIDENLLSSISGITCLNSLRKLSIQGNLVRSIPKDVYKNFIIDFYDHDALDREADSAIYIANNPLNFPPTSVIQLGREVTTNYYENAETFGHQPLSEGRVIFVGDGSSGKTSLIEKMVHHRFQLGRAQTNGIKIENLHLQHPDDGRELSFHFWDFGGQEIQHAVHKFFFTEGCLYVLVLDNRKEEEPEYWLQQIESLGGSAPVMVVFNKHDQNPVETADRKLLKEKYPNIVGFFSTSCATDFGVPDFRKVLEEQLVKLRTVEEEFPKNWLAIKKAIEERTTSSQHYLTYETYSEVCRQNHVENEDSQKLLLQYFNKVGAVTWFGEDANLKFMHVLNPEWITKGVYKIVTGKKTANLYGQISLRDFPELLQPVDENDYTYKEEHYVYLLNMMRKFQLCYCPDDRNMLIPSAFGKTPKVEYSDFRGEGVHTYILQFKDYMPIALIHRFIAMNISRAVERNYWYSGIVLQDAKTATIAMVHADKEAKRIYLRIKGENPLGVWEHERRVLAEIIDSYAKIKYDELVALDERTDSAVKYDDLISHIQANRYEYFHPKNKRTYKVPELLSYFERKDETVDKFRQGKLKLNEHDHRNDEHAAQLVQQFFINATATAQSKSASHSSSTVNIHLVHQLSADLQGEIAYLQEQTDKNAELLVQTLALIKEFAEDAEKAEKPNDVVKKGWGRKLLNTFKTLGDAGRQAKGIKDGSEILKSVLEKTQELTSKLNMHEVVNSISIFLQDFN